MNISLKKFLSNFSITLLANFISMLVSSTAVLIIPAFIGVKEYGYWQLYVFYCSYTAYLSFGITDGVYIRNGGKKYDELNKSQIKAQYFVLLIMNVILTIATFLFLLFFGNDVDKSIVLILSFCSAIIIIPRSLLTMTLLAVNRIKENALITIVDRLVYLSLIMIFLLFKIKSFYFLVIADLIGQLVSSLLAIFLCKDIIFTKINNSISEILKETKVNMTIGIKIVVAGLASMLIVGIVRMGIEQNWGVEEFAKVSLTLSVCNILLIFIKAVSVVIFPLLCNSDNNVLNKIYIFSKDSLSIVLLGALVFYYPIKLVLSIWLPQYSDSLKYMAFLFPISLYESKTQLLLNTYFKALRKENLLLLVNIITVLLSVVFSFISIEIMNSIDLAIFSIVLLLFIRCYISEFFLMRALNLSDYINSFIEACVSLSFILFNWTIGGILGMLLYLLVYILYLVLKRKELKLIYANLKNQILKKDKGEINV